MPRIKVQRLRMPLLLRVLQILDPQKQGTQNALVVGPSFQPKMHIDIGTSGKGTAMVSASAPFSERLTTSAIIERIPSKWPRPVWHRPWKNYRVRISFFVAWWLTGMPVSAVVDFMVTYNGIGLLYFHLLLPLGFKQKHFGAPFLHWVTLLAWNFLAHLADMSSMGIWDG